MQEIYKIGNAQSIGFCQVQSSYFSTKFLLEAGNPVMAVLSDGTIDHINGRRCAVLAAEICMHEFRNIPDSTGMPAFFEAIARKILREMHEIIYNGKQPYLSLGIQVIKDRKLFYYNAGSTRMFLSDGTDFRFLTDRSGQVFFSRGMTAALISKGIWEALNEKEMKFYLNRKGHPYEKAQQMLHGVKTKKRKRAGNAAVVLIEGCL